MVIEKIGYIVMLITEFAKPYHYGIMHTLSLDDNLISFALFGKKLFLSFK